EGVADQKLSPIWGPVHIAEDFHSIGSPERHLLLVRPIRLGGEDAGNICCDLACERDPAVRAWECGVSRSSARDHVYDERRQREYEQTESAIECSGFHVASCVRIALAGFWVPPLEGAIKLAGPPNVPRSISLYLVCCAASGTGSASAANRTMNVVRLNVMYFMASSFVPEVRTASTLAAEFDD